VITGMGALTALGTDVESTWNAVLEGRSGVRQIRQFESDAFPINIGSEVDLDELEIDVVDDSLRRFVTRSVNARGLGDRRGLAAGASRRGELRPVAHRPDRRRIELSRDRGRRIRVAGRGAELRSLQGPVPRDLRGHA
jgi:hypothetical protein